MEMIVVTTPRMRNLFCVMVLASGSGTLRAQATPVPCRDAPCSLIVDWGVKVTINDMPPDRKYGGPADFDAAIRQALQSHQLTAVALAPDSKTAIRVRAAYATNVACEDMQGTMPDRSCATVGEAIAEMATTETNVKLPTAVRMINRCGASGAVMSMKQFGKYVGEMIWYSLEGEKQKASKPSGKC